MQPTGLLPTGYFQRLSGGTIYLILRLGSAPLRPHLHSIESQSIEPNCYPFHIGKESGLVVRKGATGQWSFLFIIYKRPISLYLE